LLPHSFNQTLVRRLYGRPCEDTFPAFYRLNTERAVRRACDSAGVRVGRVRRRPGPGGFPFSQNLLSLAAAGGRSLEWLCRGAGRLYLTITLERESDAIAVGFPNSRVA